MFASTVSILLVVSSIIVCWGLLVFPDLNLKFREISFL